MQGKPFKFEIIQASLSNANFVRDGYIIVENVINKDLCDQIIKSVQEEKFISVSQADKYETTKFLTKNGDDLIRVFPIIKQIESEILYYINAISGRNLKLLTNRAIGLSMNVTRPGGAFGMHNDRNELTTVLFLNEPAGGDLLIYPRFSCRFCKALRAGQLIKRFTESRNFIISWIHKIVFNPIRISPKSGMLVAFTVDMPHRVDVVEAGPDRYCLVFGFDTIETNFLHNQTYYGYSDDTVTLN